MSYGLYIKADNGTLLANTEFPSYVLHETVWPASADGNVFTYYSTSPSAPLCFMAIPIGVSAGVLSIESSGSAWIIRVISSSAVKVYVFRRIMQADGAVGYGANLYAADGSLTYSSSAKVLMANSIQPFSIGSVVNGGENNLVSHIAANTYAVRNVTYEQQLFHVYVADRYTKMVQVCRYDVFKGYICWYESRQVEVIARIWGTVKRTDWQVMRGAIKRIPGQFAHDWVVHKSGYYKEVIEVRQSFTTTFSTSDPAYAGGSSWAYAFVPSLTEREGTFSHENTFPYTDGISNNVSATVVMTQEADYV
jgi:hypothetical protein